MPPPRPLKILLTGSSSGIGRALAEKFLADGHAVWGVARRDQADPAGARGNFRASAADVADWTAMQAVGAAIARDWGRLDAVVTCAGLQGEIGRTLTADPAAWSATVRANLDGTFHAIRAVSPLLDAANGRAKVVCFSGGGATKPRPNFSAYGAAKSAIVRLVETIAMEEAGRPLDINAVAPGAVPTRLTDEVIARGPSIAGHAEYEAAVALKTAGDAPLAKALALVGWLLSPASDGISGRLLSAPWDPWITLDAHRDELAKSDIFTLRRITPEDRGTKW